MENDSLRVGGFVNAFVSWQLLDFLSLIPPSHNDVFTQSTCHSAAIERNVERLRAVLALAFLFLPLTSVI